MMLHFKGVIAPFMYSVDGLDLYNEAINFTQGDVCITTLEQKDLDLVYESRSSYFERLYRAIPQELEHTANLALSQLNGGEVNIAFDHVSRSLMGETKLCVYVSLCGAAYESLMSFYRDNIDTFSMLIKQEYKESALADELFYQQLRAGEWRPISLLLSELIKAQLEGSSMYEFMVFNVMAEDTSLQFLKYSILDSDGNDTFYSLSDFSNS